MEQDLPSCTGMSLWGKCRQANSPKEMEVRHLHSQVSQRTILQVFEEKTLNLMRTGFEYASEGDTHQIVK